MRHRGALLLRPLARALQWFPEILWLRQHRLRAQLRILGAAVLVGVVAGLAAVLFYLATRAVSAYALGVVAGYAPPEAAGDPHVRWLPSPSQPLVPWLLVAMPALGGLLSGWLVFRFAPEAEGHGTDAVVAAYHDDDGYIRPRVPLVKLLASTITLGSGGSGGREGPIAQIGAGFGSALSGVLRLRPADRRVLTAAGMGAGIAAIFRAPLAGALFAAEVLYSSPELEAEVIVPAAFASVISYCTFGLFFGWRPLFAIPNLEFSRPAQLLPYTVLALSMAFLAMIYTRTFRATTALFQRARAPRMIKPAIGALGAGALAVLLYTATGRVDVLSTLSFGYGSLQRALVDEPSLGAGILFAIALGKIATTSLTIGSGGSGGVFGPSMVIGGSAGGAIGVLAHHAWPTAVPDPAAFVVVGMAGFFAAAAKTPFSTLVIVTEMTGGYQLLLPALWVCVIAFVVSDRESIYRSQVQSHSRSPAHKGSYVREAVAGLRVGALLKPGVVLLSLSPDDTLPTIAERIAADGYSVLPVVDRANRVVGVVNVEDAHAALHHTAGTHVPVVAADLMRTDVVPLVASDAIDRAQELFVENDLLALPVVESLDRPELVGMVRRFEVASIYLERVHGRRRSRARDRSSP